MSHPIPVQQITSLAVIPVSLGTAAGTGSAVLYNESIYTLLVQGGGASKYIPAWTGDRFDPGAGFDGSITITPQSLSTASDAPSAFVLITAYGKAEAIPGTYPVALARVTNIGNGTISTSTANSVIVSGETVPNDLVKASPTGYVSPTVDLIDTGAFVLRPLSNNAQVPALQVIAGDATHYATVQLDNNLIATDGQGNLSTQKVTAAGKLTVSAGGASITGGLTVVTGGVALTTGGITVGAGSTTSLDGGAFLTDGAGSFTAKGTETVGALLGYNTTVNTEAYVDIVRDIAPGNLIAYYRLDEASGGTVFDFSPNGLNGTTHGSPTQNVAGALTGDSDTAYTFASASSQYVSLPASSFPSGNQPWSLCAWIKFAANPAAQATVMAFGTAANHESASLYVDTSGVFHAGTYSGDTTGGSALSAAVWHFVAGTWDGTTLKAYLDGAAYGTNATPGAMAIPSPCANANIGAQVVNQQFWNGQIDEPAYFNCTLTAAQITALYNLGHSGPTTGLDVVQAPGVQTPQSGSANGFAFLTWNGSAGVWSFSVGGRYKSALSWIDASGNYGGPAGCGVPTTRNGVALSVPIFTGANNPVNPPTGAIWYNK